MMMIVDGSGARVSFDEMASGLDEIGTGIGVNIKCQREEIFTKMQEAVQDKKQLSLHQRKLNSIGMNINLKSTIVF